MARKLTASAAGVPEHIIQRGNNSKVVIAIEEDMMAYVTWLKDYAKKYNVAIHAWVLMNNHVQLSCTPSSASGISQMMQSFEWMCVLYFDRRHQRTGTLWERRYRSCLVREETYLLELHRYIELNPVTAGMVDEPAGYLWSSYQCNGLGKKSDLLMPHKLLIALGANADDRQLTYRSLFKTHVVKKICC